MEDVLVTSKEDGVVERRRELARPPADVDLAVTTLDASGNNCSGALETLGCSALSSGVIN